MTTAEAFLGKLSDRELQLLKLVAQGPNEPGGRPTTAAVPLSSWG